MNATKRWLCSYAYDVPCYRDFVVEAETEEEARQKIEKALADGVFTDVMVKECLDNWISESERVFVSNQLGPDEDAYDDMLVDGKLVDASEVPK